MKTQHKHLLQRTYLVLVFGFMYLPIAVLIAYSFNENKSRAVFTGFSLKWYASLFHNEMILSALGLSLVLAFVSAIIATVLGTLATIGINSMSRKAQLIINNTVMSGCQPWKSSPAFPSCCCSSSCKNGHWRREWSVRLEHPADCAYHLQRTICYL